MIFYKENRLESSYIDDIQNISRTLEIDSSPLLVDKSTT